MYCLGCGTDLTNQQANRRVISSLSDIVDLWKTVVSEWDEEYTSAEDIVQEQPYMCRGCFSAYSRFIAMKIKITTNIAEAMRCFSYSFFKETKMESPYTASELSLSNLSTSSLEDSAATALNLSRPSASSEVGVSHVC